MYTVRISCSCGATFEMEFDLNMTSRTESMCQQFLEAHKDCCKYIHSDSGDPIAAEIDVLKRLDELKTKK